MSKPAQASSPASRPRVFASLIRGETKPAALAIGLVTFIAWAVSFFLFSYGTAAGRADLQQRGFLALLLGWLLISALISLGYALGYLVLRSLSPGTKSFVESRVVRLSLMDAFAAMAGGYFVGFFPMTLTNDVLMLLAWTAVIGVCFSFAAINPGYVRRFREAVAAGQVVRDRSAE